MKNIAQNIQHKTKLAFDGKKSLFWKDIVAVVVINIDDEIVAEAELIG